TARLAGDLVEHHVLDHRARGRNRIPRAMRCEPAIAFLAGEVIAVDPGESEHGPVRVHQPIGLNRLVGKLDDVGALRELRPGHTVAYDEWRPIKAAFEIMIKFLRRIEIGDRLVLPRFFAERLAEVVRAVIESPDLLCAGAKAQLLGVADAGAE